MFVRKNLRKILSMSALMGLLASCGGNGYDIKKQDVAGGSAVYEIFVGSFCDSNGDGVGDLKGIESKLDYLQNLGVSYLWLTPVHPSNSYHKYDVKDYYAIDSSFGTVADFESLVSKAKEKGIGILMDMVFNHASRQSTWFNSFAAAARSGDRESEYINDFVWSVKPKEGYAAYDECGGVYVECNFDQNMPEFNLESDHVRAELVKIQNYWLDKGVAGFRYDAVLYYYCSNSGGVISGDTEKNVSFMKYLADSAKAKKPDVYLVGEAWVNDQNLIATYASSGMNAFNFVTSGVDASGSAGKAVINGGEKDFAKAVENAQAKLRAARADADLCFFVSNHDTDRWGGYRNGQIYAEEARKCVASAYLLTPGTPFAYYGEEIQMLGTRTSSESTDASRRQAMVWGEGEPMCKQPEGKTVPEQVTIGVKEAEKDGYSMLNHYRKVLSIRNAHKDLFRKGTFTALDLGPERVAGFKITLNNETYYLIHNCFREAVEITVPGSEIVDSVNTFKVAPTLANSKLSLAAYSSVLMR